MRKLISTLSVIFLLFNANAQDQECLIDDENTPALLRSGECNDYTNYIPDINAMELTPQITYKVNLHFIRKSDGSGIYQPTQDLEPAFDQIFDWVNQFFNTLHSPTLPVSPPADEVPSTKIRFEVQDMYFHDDTELYVTGSPPCLINDFLELAENKGLGCSINIFFNLHSSRGSGGCVNNLESINIRVHQKSDDLIPRYISSPWTQAQLIAHELGHSLALPHTFPGNNGCGDDIFDDTYYPDNNKDWAPCGLNEPYTDCGGGIGISNNIMGYNTCRRYFSPKQIGYMHERTLNTQRINFLVDTYDPSKTVEVNSNQTWEHRKFFNGDLIVKSGNTLTVKCKLFFSPDSKVIVEPGAKLMIDGGHLTNSGTYDCSGEQKFWQGIEVWGNHNLPQTETNQGVVELKNDGVIEYALNGIRTIERLSSGHDWSKTGGIVRCMGGTFKDCRRGIEFMYYENKSPFGNPLPNVSYIQNTSFIITDDYPEGVYPNTGISAYHVQGINIRNNLFENQRSDLNSLLYSQRGRGISSIDCALNIRSFTNIHGVPTTDTGNEFKNLFYGVMTSSGSVPENLTVLDNTFTNCLYGLGLTGSNYSVVGRNVIEVPLVPDNDPQADFAFGIYTDYGDGFNLEQNVISTLGTGSNASNQGIHVSHASTQASQAASVYKNTITGVKYGLQLTGGNQNLEIDCNHFVKEPVSTIDIHHVYGALGHQGDCNAKPVKNTFSGTCNSTSLAQFYRESGAGISIYQHAPNTLSSNCHNLSFFAFECGSTPQNNCPNTLPGGIIILPGGIMMSQSEGDSSDETKILQSEITSLIQEIEVIQQQLQKGNDEKLKNSITKETNEQIKADLLSASPYLSDEILMAYIEKAQKDKNITSDVVEIALANAPLSSEVIAALETLSVPAMSANQINSEQSGVPQRLQLEGSYNQLKRNKINTMNRLVKYYLDSNLINDAVLFFESDTSIESTLVLLKLELKRNNISKALEHLSAIELFTQKGILLSEEEHTELLSLIKFYQLAIAFTQQNGGIYSASSAQINELTELANSKTSAGRQALSILHFLREELPYFNGQEAYFPKSMTLEESYDLLTVDGISSLFDVFPNPADDELTIRIKDSDSETVYAVIITDINGKIITILSDVDDFIQVDVSAFSNGTYLAHLVQGETRLETKKIVKK